jgi:outer membrane protein OmpA-like peptidoglycan-associated protein
MSIKQQLLLGTSFVMLLGCAHTPPAELVNAREAYEQAAEGPSKKYTPADLHVAKTALDLAEKSFHDQEETWIVQSQAYVATRKAQVAASLARTHIFELGLAASEMKEEQLKDYEAAMIKSQLATANRALTDEQAAGEASSREHAAELAAEQEASATKSRELAEEKKLRAEADKRAAIAIADLARIGAVTQETRGTVITLSGSVLFASSKYALLPAAQAKLSEVALALLAGDPSSTFLVEGHTDTQGKDDANMVLSQNRANAVRDYLIQHEIAADRITAAGLGEGRSISDNSSAEGRANNRRVEIVVRPGKG